MTLPFRTTSRARLPILPPLFLSALAMVALTCLLLVGCHKPAFETVPVSGTVSYKGIPAPYGEVRFEPVDPAQGRATIAIIQSDGAYTVRTLRDVKGLVPGEYRVFVTFTPPMPRGPEDTAKKTSAKLLSKPLAAPALSLKSTDDNRVFDITLDGK
jgi:hypothetical protein